MFSRVSRVRQGSSVLFHYLQMTNRKQNYYIKQIAKLTADTELLYPAHHAQSPATWHPEPEHTTLLPDPCSPVRRRRICSAALKYHLACFFSRDKRRVRIPTDINFGLHLFRNRYRNHAALTQNRMYGNRWAAAGIDLPDLQVSRCLIAAGPLQ
jgi:hypothetical protein